MGRVAVRLFTRRLNLRNPFTISHGTYHWRDNVFVSIEYDGVIGIGEAPVVPYYGDTVESVVADIESNVTAALVRRSVEESVAPETRFATSASRCALNTAIVDIKAKRRGLSLGAYLELGTARPTLTSYTIPYNESAEAMVRSAEGHACLKVKLGFPDDIEKLRVLRRRSPNAIIRIDANQGWSLPEALRKVKALEQLGVELIEEPLSTSLDEVEALASL